MSFSKSFFKIMYNYDITSNTINKQTAVQISVRNSLI
jgi:hypothetical protein